MNAFSRFLTLVVAVFGGLTLAACGGSDLSPVASSAALPTDGGSVTSSGNGPGGPPRPAPSPGTGTCTNNCDGTGQGPGPGAGSGPGPGDGRCGNACTSPVGPDPEYAAAMLVEALQEEYRTHYLYASVLEDYPGARPFAAIAESERRHVEALQQLFARRQMAPPASAWTAASFDPFASIQAACAGGVKAETEDADSYAPYLKLDDLPQDVRNVFVNLQAASLHSHLPAFEACAGLSSPA